MSEESLLEQDKIKNILNSDSSLDVLLNRLKQSLTTGEEFAKYIKRKAQIEDEHYGQLKKFGIQARASIKGSSKLKNDSFSAKLDEIIEFDEKLFGAGSSYVKALNVMYDELSSLIGTISRSRKLIRDEGKKKEKECIDSIIAAEKAKQKYYHLCEDLEKLKTSDPNKKSFSLKNKTVEQQEDDLQRKVDLADQDYKLKVTTCKKLKDEILMNHRPTSSKKLKNLVLEMDIAMNVQLQKFATWNETLIMNSGVLISPIQLSKSSMKSIASSIDNEKDLYDYLVKHGNIHKNQSLVPVEYTMHPSVAKTQKIGKPFLNNSAPKNINSQPKASTINNLSPPANSLQPLSDSSYSNSTAQAGSINELVTPSNYTYSSLDPSTKAGSDLNGPKTLNTQLTQHTQPTFGVSVEDVIQFAGIDNVPLVVKRCIEVIESHGMDIEGIYRTSGNKTTVQNLKNSIDQQFTNYLLIGNNIDPNNVLDADIYCVASLLKIYFASLPEPLLTKEYYQSFIETVKSLDETFIAKKLHHLVFNLPDGAYFTLRALIFHLNKVASNQNANRMTAKNLAIIWGPAILNDNSMSPQDLSYKSKVVEELMLIATEIFETDE
ncbi:RhoGAP-domain-containing protein [Suhomyces tanzawaensis NRRL Y-17324]|uniref:RhoGAP-domain-containing protein n=1 Tax=Suhomyces tanzawaensis NRRL Y-17324 TaxID=984487 RepID=A0A1E4SPF9_9ASCO|nr:RhoGAP-domain-containing protein [Suhomyces tanzawaensis NRRL Y-17324]ODV81376.1 RhoGAP-domain-containing protein [Suhomyces tanzawaensis NRRL Y-17324]